MDGVHSAYLLGIQDGARLGSHRIPLPYRRRHHSSRHYSSSSSAGTVFESSPYHLRVGFNDPLKTLDFPLLSTKWYMIQFASVGPSMMADVFRHACIMEIVDELVLRDQVSRKRKGGGKSNQDWVM